MFEGLLLSGLKAIAPYLLAIVGFFGWKWNHDRQVLTASKQKDELRRQTALANAMAIERPSPDELRESLRRNSF